jgi:regulation of enolase protein 1 (concanavalin A-like superfamily)
LYRCTRQMVPNNDDVDDDVDVGDLSKSYSTYCHGGGLFFCVLFVIVLLQGSYITTTPSTHTLKTFRLAQGSISIDNSTTTKTMTSSASTGSSATSTRTFIPIQGFPTSAEDIGKDGGLKWFCAPDSWNETLRDGDREGRDGWWKIDEKGKLIIAPPAKKDFWRKTYYQPLMVKDDGPFLYATVPKDKLPVTIQTTLSLIPKAQFDQAGIFIRLDKEHWIKTGIEVVDEQPRLSCVVCNGFSDWSTQNWSAPAVMIRVHILPQNGGSFVVEAAPVGTDDWVFIRIAHMNVDHNHNLLNDHPTVQAAYEGESAPPGTLMAGVFSASPIDQVGTVATFEDLSITPGSGFVHDF